mgnify:CR=1 FL=1
MIAYSVPLELVAGGNDRPLIVRLQHPGQLGELVSLADPADLLHIELPLSPSTVEEIAEWRQPVPLHLVLSDPRDYPLLYRCTTLLDHCPVRVAIPLIAGFARAVRLAASLNFPVKLEIVPPARQLLDELVDVLELYLHRSTVAQPIEPFHSSLLAIFHQEPLTLWSIQEEDPALFRVIAENGEERLPGRLASEHSSPGSSDFLEVWRGGLLAEQGECASCPHFDYCGGYFKWPDRSFSCAGVRMLFDRLSLAAAELRHDLAAFSSAGVEDSR